MRATENNFAYIDTTNLSLGVASMGWFLDFKKFRIYLKEKYRVSVAYLFLGYLPNNQDWYNFLQKAGYVLIFKPVLPDKDGKPKGNCDADLVLRCLIDFYKNKFDSSIIVSSDGDFYSLVNHLYQNKKLLKVISPYKKTCSLLLRKSAKERIIFLDNLKQKLSRGTFKRKSTA